MMAASGPSDRPTNLLGVVGQGLAGGVGAYDKSLENDLDANKLAAANKINNVKLQSLQDSQNRASSFIQKFGAPSENGYSISALFALHQMQLANGDEAGAKQTQAQIQELQQTAAGNGMVLGENGYELAPGYGESLRETKAQESLGNAVGQNAQITADQKDFRAGMENPAFRAYELEKAKSNQSNVNVNTAPKDGEIWRAMDKERENASGSQAGLKLVYEMKNSLPNAITGFGADYLLMGQKAIAALGGDASRVVDTETLQTQSMELAAKMKGELVGNQQISDSDMRFVQQVAAGDTKLDGGTIKRLVDVREKQLIGNIDRYNSRVSQIYPDTPDNATNRNYFGGINIPENPYANKSGKGSSATGDTNTGPSATSATVIGNQDDYRNLPVGATYRFPDDPQTMIRTKR